MNACCKQFAKTCLPVSLGLFIFMSQPVLGAEEAVDLGKIDVTGTHIKRVDMEGPSPLLVMDRETIERSGAISVSEFIRDLPINTGPSFDETFAQSTSPGGSSFNMRGLGQDGTLILIDGRRVANYGFAQDGTTSFVDLNSIPLAAVERIEILKDGASAIYGSDAIAGVVNIILRKDLDVTELSLGYGTSSQNDGTENKFNILTGFNNEKSSLSIVLDYFNRDSIKRADRDFSENADHTSEGGNDLSSWATPVSNVYGLVTDDWLTPSTGGVPDNRYNFNQDIDLIPASKRYGALANFNHEINSDLTFFSQAVLSQTITDLDFTYTPEFGNAFIPATHPDNPYGEPVIVAWRMTDMGIRKFNTKTDTLRFVAGLEGIMDSWDWNTAFNYSRSKSVVKGENQVNATSLQNAIIAGTINPFGIGTTNTQAALDGIRETITRTGTSENKGIDFKASSDIAELEYGLLMLAVGAERRHESYSDIPDAISASGEILGLGSLTDAKGSRDTTSFFTELDWPVMDNMNIQLAARHERYSDFGTTTNPKLALRYQPTSNLVLRASTGTGFRAPALTELYLEGGSGFQTLIDTTRCTATGGVSGCTPATYAVNFTGDPDLDAEKSRSSYLGAVFEPIKVLSIGVDYWVYEHTDVIDLNSQYVIDNEASFPGRVVRAVPGDSTSPIVGINDTFSNIANQETRGYDIQIQYKKKFGPLGTLGITEMYSRMLEFKRRPFDGQPYEELAGTYSYPTQKSTTVFSWSHTVYSTQLSANYINGYEGLDPSTNVDADLTFDFQFSYTGWEFGRATFGANNLTDKAPPFADEEPGYDFATHNPRGRFIYAQYTHTL